MPRFFNNILGQSTADCTGVNTGAIQTLGGLYVTKQAQVSGVLTVLNTTDSTTTLNGSGVFAGGVGVGKALTVGTTATAPSFVATAVAALTTPATSWIGPSQAAGVSFYSGTVTVPGLFNVQSKATLAASVAGAASLSVPNGVAVTAPATGDMWAVGGNLYYYTGSATINLTTGGAGMSNPMTTNGDMIVEAGGVPARLAAGTNGNVLTVVAGAPAWAPPSSGGTTVLGGTAILDFGTNQGAASVAVTGQTGILTTSNIHATVSAVATANKGADEVYMDPIVLSVGPPIAGTGFTIYGTSLNKFTSGQYQVNWSWF